VSQKHAKTKLVMLLWKATEWDDSTQSLTLKFKQGHVVTRSTKCQELTSHSIIWDG